MSLVINDINPAMPARGVRTLNRKRVTCANENGTIVVIEVVGVDVGGHCLSFLFLVDDYSLIPVTMPVNLLHNSYISFLFGICLSKKIPKAESSTKNKAIKNKEFKQRHFYLADPMITMGRMGIVQTRIETITEYIFHSLLFLFSIILLY